MSENERIRELRKTLNLTMEKFGNRLGVTKVAISNIENGNRKVTEQMFKSICREFNVNEEWLRTGQGEMFIEISQDEQIASFIGTLLRDNTDSFKKRYISMLASLDESDWETLEKVTFNCNK